MRIEELKANEKVPYCKAQIIALKDILETQHGKLRDATAQDQTGEVTLTLWREQTDMFAEGDVVVIKDGWCKEFNGALQMSTGKHGSIVKEDG